MAGDDVRQEANAPAGSEPVRLDWVVAALDELVLLQETVRRSSLRWGVLFLGLGALAAAALHLLPQLRSLAPIQKVGPLVVLAAVASLHYEPWAVARQRAAGLRSLRRLLIRAEGLEGPRRRTAVQEVLEAAQAVIGDGKGDSDG